MGVTRSYSSRRFLCALETTCPILLCPYIVATAQQRGTAVWILCEFCDILEDGSLPDAVSGLVQWWPCCGPSELEPICPSLLGSQWCVACVSRLLYCNIWAAAAGSYTDRQQEEKRKEKLGSQMCLFDEPLLIPLFVYFWHSVLFFFDQSHCKVV